MDFISAAASVVGLVQMASKVTGFLSTTAGASKTASDVLAEINAL
jgi:hypothetical protein